jgi:hypothetical protein
MNVSQVDSYYEGMNLATNAINYLNSYGSSDPVFIDYFGADVTAISGPLSIFTVCPGYIS